MMLGCLPGVSTSIIKEAVDVLIVLLYAVPPAPTFRAAVVEHRGGSCRQAGMRERAPDDKPRMVEHPRGGLWVVARLQGHGCARIFLQKLVHTGLFHYPIFSNLGVTRFFTAV